MSDPNNIDVVINTRVDAQNAVRQMQEGMGNVSAAISALNLEFKTANNGLERIANTVGLVAKGFVFLQSLRVFQNIAGDAARAEALGTVLHVVAKNAGISREAIDAVDKSVQKLGITAQTSRESLAQFVKAGLSAGSAAQLARAAQDLAVLSGGNSSDTFRDLTQAIDEMSIVMLRFRGISVTNEEAQARYAAANGKSVATLEDWEKKQALLNLVLERSARLSGIYEAAMGDVAKQAASLERYQTEASTSIGQGLLPAYSSVVLELTNFLRYLKLSADAMLVNGDGGKALGKTVGDIMAVMRSATEFMIDHSDAIFNVAKAYVAMKLAMGGAAAFSGVRTALMGGAAKVDATGAVTQPAKVGIIPAVRQALGSGTGTGAAAFLASQSQTQGQVATARSAASQAALNAATAQHNTLLAQGAAATQARRATYDKIMAAQSLGTTASAREVTILTEKYRTEMAVSREKAKQIALSAQQLTTAAAQNAAAAQHLATLNATNTAGAFVNPVRGRAASAASSVGSAITSLIGTRAAGAATAIGGLATKVAGLVGGWGMLGVMTAGYWLIFDNGYKKTLNALETFKLKMVGTDKEIADHKKRVAKDDEQHTGIAGYKDAVKEQLKAEQEAIQMQYQEGKRIEALKSSGRAEDIEEREKGIAEIAEKKKIAAEKAAAVQALVDKHGISEKDQGKVVTQAQKETFRGGQEFNDLRQMQSLMTTRQKTGQMDKVFNGGLTLSMGASTAFEGFRKEFDAFGKNLAGADASIAHINSSLEHFVDSIKTTSDGIILLEELQGQYAKTQRIDSDLENIKWGQESPYDPASQGKEDIAYKALKKEIENESNITGETVVEVANRRKVRNARMAKAKDITSEDSINALEDTYGALPSQGGLKSTESIKAFAEQLKASPDTKEQESSLLKRYQQSVDKGETKAVSKEDIALVGDEKLAKLIKAKQLISDLREELLKVESSSEGLLLQATNLKLMEAAVTGLTQRIQAYAKAVEKVTELYHAQDLMRQKLEASGTFKAEGAGAHTVEAERTLRNAEKEYTIGLAKAKLEDDQRRRVIADDRNKGIATIASTVNDRGETDATAKKTAHTKAVENGGGKAATVLYTEALKKQYEVEDSLKKVRRESIDAVLAKNEYDKFKIASSKDGAPQDKAKELELYNKAEAAKKAEAEAGKNDKYFAENDYALVPHMRAANEKETANLVNAQDAVLREKQGVDDAAKLKKKEGDDKVATAQNSDTLIKQVEEKARVESLAADRMVGEERLKVTQKYYDDLLKAVSQYQEGYIAKLNAIKDINKTLIDTATGLTKADISEAKTDENLKWTPNAQKLGALDAAEQRNEIGASVTKHQNELATHEQTTAKKAEFVNSETDALKANAETTILEEKAKKLAEIDKKEEELRAKRQKDVPKSTPEEAAKWASNVVSGDKKKVEEGASEKLAESDAEAEITRQTKLKNLHELDVQTRLEKEKEFFQSLSQHRDAALQKYTEYATKAKELEKGIKDQAISDAAAMREIDRTGKSDTFKFQDKKKEMQEAYALAKQMQEMGDLEGAKKEAERGKGIARSLAGASGVSLTEGRESASKGYAQGAALVQDLNKTMAKQNNSAAGEQKEIYESMKDAAGESSERLAKLGKQAKIELEPSLNDASIKSALAKLSKAMVDQTTEINAILSESTFDSIRKQLKDAKGFVIDVEAKVKQGGSSGSNSSGSAEITTPNGTIPAVQKADGGLISGAGTGTSDSIPAMLSHGEFIIKQDSVSHYGKGFLDLVNSKALRFASGGFVQRFSDGGLSGNSKKSKADEDDLSTSLSVLKINPKTGKYERYTPADLRNEAGLNKSNVQRFADGGPAKKDLAIQRSQNASLFGGKADPNSEIFKSGVFAGLGNPDSKGGYFTSGSGVAVGDFNGLAEKGSSLNNRMFNTDAAKGKSWYGSGLGDMAASKGRTPIAQSFMGMMTARQNQSREAAKDVAQSMNQNGLSKYQYDMLVAMGYSFANGGQVMRFSEGGGTWVDNPNGDGQRWVPTPKEEKKGLLQELKSLMPWGNKKTAAPAASAPASSTPAPTIENTVNLIQERKRELAALTKGFASGGFVQRFSEGALVDGKGGKWVDNPNGGQSWVKDPVETKKSIIADILSWGSKPKAAPTPAPTIASAAQQLGSGNQTHKAMKEMAAAGYAEGGFVEDTLRQLFGNKGTRNAGGNTGGNDGGGFFELLKKGNFDLLANASKKNYQNPTATIGIRGATGGLFGGAGTIPALVSNGEFRLNADAVAHYGAELMSSINDMALPKFASGGAVGGSSEFLSKDASRSASINDSIDLNFKIGNAVHKAQANPDSAKSLALALKNLAASNLA